jgi:hydroxypyruvate reductase
MLSIAKAARAEDHVLVLLSGGGSALLCAPGPGLALSRKRVVTQALIRSGATIQEINLVRRRLSAIKGGRLAAAAAPARITTLAVSDVIGDAPEDIASGPTAPDPTTMDQALHVLDHYGIAVPDAGWSESLKQGDLAFARSTYRVIASSAGSLKAVRDASEAAGYHAVDLGEALQGEARATGFAHAKAVETYCAKSGRYALISGGELTVRVSGGGRGGPNFEYAAALASRIEGLEGVFGLAADTDGLDGNAEAAGAFFSGASAEAARKAGLSFEQALDTNDAGGAFERIGGVFAPGPTGTNVNDVRIILISR